MTLRAKRRCFQELTRRIPGETLSAEQVRDALSHYFPKYLNLLEDHRTTTQGSEEWHFTLTLWSRDRQTNLRHFDELWEEKRPEKSKAIAISQTRSTEALETPNQSKPRCFISYRSQDPDQLLAQTFQAQLKAEGYDVFLAGESIRLGENWVQRIEQELQACDYMLLLLSEQAALSEMVTEEVRRAKQQQEQTGKPFILPIRVNFPLQSPLNYDLRGYLQHIQQREWKGAEDTPQILEEVLDLLRTGALQEIPEPNEKQDTDSLSSADPLIEQESLQIPPLPVAEPELPSGQVDLASPFYVERTAKNFRKAIETRCYDEIMQPGALIRIKAPRQMGKTSLMSRIVRHGELNGCCAVPLSFQVADSIVFENLDVFLRWFAATIGRRIKRPNRLAEFWDEIFGSKDNCTAYFEDYLLAELSQPLVLCLDEADMVFKHPEVASDFFGLLRSWHDMGKTREIWKKLRLVVVHSTEVYIPMDIHQSPFNVGLPIELPEFTAEQVQELAARHGLSWRDAEVRQLMGMVGGHPYLVRMALYYVTQGEQSLEAVLEDAPTEAGLYGDHLRRHWWNIQQNLKLREAIQQLLGAQSAIQLDAVEAFQLYSMGLVKLYGNKAMFQSKLYRLYLGDRLGAR